MEFNDEHLIEAIDANCPDDDLDYETEFLTEEFDCTTEHSRTVLLKINRSLSKKYSNVTSHECRTTSNRMSKHKKTNKEKRQRKNATKKTFSVYNCRLCDKQFETSTERDEHEEIEHRDSEQMYNCPYAKCNVRNRHAAAIKSHIARHTGSQYQCNICSKYYAEKRLLDKHRKMHYETRPRNFLCQICSKRFLNISSLKAHLDRHKTNRKSFRCMNCDKCFRDRTDLRRHRQQHSSVATVKCSFCEQKFFEWEMLRQHCTRKHPEKELIDDTDQCLENSKENLENNEDTVGESKQEQIDTTGISIESNVNGAHGHSDSIVKVVNEMNTKGDHESLKSTLSEIYLPKIQYIEELLDSYFGKKNSNAESSSATSEISSNELRNISDELNEIISILRDVYADKDADNTDDFMKLLNLPLSENEQLLKLNENLSDQLFRRRFVNYIRPFEPCKSYFAVTGLSRILNPILTDQYNYNDFNGKMIMKDLKQFVDTLYEAWSHKYTSFYHFADDLKKQIFWAHDKIYRKKKFVFK